MVDLRDLPLLDAAADLPARCLSAMDYRRILPGSGSFPLDC